MSTADHERQSALRGLKYEQEANMKHTLRKYLSSRGSALFMVLSTMTALLIVVMAMYFSVVSSRSVQYAVFNQEQSYQSSISVADAVIAGLNDGKLNTLSGEFFKLNVGESKSTNGNGFASLYAGGTKDDDPEIGAYDVTVTRLNDEGEFYVYDFVVTAKVNGVTETTHTLVRLSAGKPAPPPTGKTFTATGYLPNENWVGLGNYYDEVHIDSEYAVIGLEGAAIFGDYTAAGSVEINNTTQTSSDGMYNIATNEPKHWSIGNNLKLSTQAASSNINDWLNHGTDDEHTTVVVGGDLYINDTCSFPIPQYVDVYVLGDCYLGTMDNVMGNLFVGGRFYATGNMNGTGKAIRQGTNGYIYLSSDDDIDEYATDPYGAANSHIVNWAANVSADDEKLYTREKAVDALNTAIGSNAYPKWVPEVEEIADGGKRVDIAFNSTWHDVTDPFTHAVIPQETFVVEHPDLKYSESNTSVMLGNIYNAAAWDDGTATANNYYIIIDTGDDPKNVFTIRLLANTYLEADDDNMDHVSTDDQTDPYPNTPSGYEDEEHKSFTWRPYNGRVCDPADTSVNTFVLIKGRGTVIFDIPENVTYQSTGRDFVGHMNWLALLSTYNDAKGHPALGDYQGMPTKVDKMIHKRCTGSNKCEYEEYYEDSKKVEGKYYCKTHECVVESTAASVADLVASFEDGICPCHNRVGRKEIAGAFDLDSLTGDFVSRDDADKFIYPTTNLWIVSCNENAEIRMSTTKDGTTFQYNPTFGFVYAPYMTFTAKAAGDEGGLRLAGGLIVSDLLLNDRYAYLYISPETNYADLIGENAVPLTPQGNRSWRKYGY